MVFYIFFCFLIFEFRVLIILQVNFMAVKWEKAVQYIYAAINLAIYVSACVSGLYPDAVYKLTFAISTTIRYVNLPIHDTRVEIPGQIFWRGEGRRKEKNRGGGRVWP